MKNENNPFSCDTENWRSLYFIFDALFFRTIHKKEQWYFKYFFLLAAAMYRMTGSRERFCPYLSKDYIMVNPYVYFDISSILHTSKRAKMLSYYSFI